MAITKELLATSKTFFYSQDFATWLESKLVPDYVDSVTYDSETNTINIVKNEQTVFSFAKNTTSSSSSTLRMSLYFDASSSVSGIDKDDTHASGSMYGFTTNNAVIVDRSNSNPTTYTDRVAFTKDQNGDLAIILGNSVGYPTSSTAGDSHNNYVAVKPLTLVAATPPTIEAMYKYYPDSTVLVPFAVYANNSEPLYTPNAFTATVAQFSVHGRKVAIDGSEYLVIGTWYFKD